MSRIGRAPIALPSGVTFENKDNLITITGPLGKLSQKVNKSIDVELKDGSIICTRHSDDGEHRAMHGLYRALINNMVNGVTKGFEKIVVANGVGYKITLTDKTKLVMNVGYSKPVTFVAPEGITFELPQPLEIAVKGIDRQLVGQVAASIRDIRPVEPYHNYGFHYKGETLIHKEGKKAAK